MILPVSKTWPLPAWHPSPCHPLEALEGPSQSMGTRDCRVRLGSRRSPHPVGISWLGGNRTAEDRRPDAWTCVARDLQCAPSLSGPLCASPLQCEMGNGQVVHMSTRLESICKTLLAASGHIPLNSRRPYPLSHLSCGPTPGPLLESLCCPPPPSHQVTLSSLGGKAPCSSQLPSLYSEVYGLHRSISCYKKPRF